MKDAKLSTSKALPAAGAAASHDSIDLGPSSSPGHISPGNVEWEISWPALTGLLDTKSIVFTFEDSADNVSFASLGSKTITGSGGAGVPAGSRSIRLPADVRRYVRVTQTLDSAGGTLTGISTTQSLVCH